MKIIDTIKDSGELYRLVKKDIVLLEVPQMQFLKIDGEKDPNQNPEYSDAVSALYSVAYKLKFMVKKGPLAIDYKVMPLEGLWWAENMADFSLENRLNWKWTMMIMQPDFITHELFAQALENARSKKENDKLENVRFESFNEGLCMQIFHQGPYGEGERETIQALHKKIANLGYALSGKHHEIYFNSPLKTAPGNLKTIIRQPIKKTIS